MSSADTGRPKQACGKQALLGMSAGADGTSKQLFSVAIIRYFSAPGPP